MLGGVGGTRPRQAVAAVRVRWMSVFFVLQALLAGLGGFLTVAVNPGFAVLIVGATVGTALTGYAIGTALATRERGSR